MFVTIVYWSLLLPHVIKYNVITDGANWVFTYFYHAFNTVYMVMDLVISARPVSLYHAYLPIFTGLLYSLFSLLYRLAGGISQPLAALMSVLQSHWSQANDVLLSLVEMVHCAALQTLLCHKEPAQGTPGALLGALGQNDPRRCNSLLLYGMLLCTEKIYYTLSALSGFFMA